MKSRFVVRWVYAAKNIPRERKKKGGLTTIRNWQLHRGHRPEVDPWTLADGAGLTGRNQAHKGLAVPATQPPPAGKKGLPP